MPWTPTPWTSPPWLIRLVAVAHRRLWLLRAKTIGVRCIVPDDSGRVFLIRHSYTPGWYLPGGGVNRGETTEAAAIRELREEGGLVCRGRPELHGLFLDAKVGHDYVACYMMRDVVPIAGGRPDWEIAEAGFFPLDALPIGTTPATKARLAEAFQGVPIAAFW